MQRRSESVEGQGEEEQVIEEVNQKVKVSEARGQA
jgi:hypothetical protein